MPGVIELYIVAALVIIGVPMILWVSYARQLGREADRLRRSDERSDLGIGLASMSVNLVALLLISVIGLAQLGFEIWKVETAGRAGDPRSSLEALLQQRLPDPEALDRQHQDIVDAIRSLRTTASGPVVVNDGAIIDAFQKLQIRIEKLEGATEQGFAGLAILKGFGWVVAVVIAAGGLLLFVQGVAIERSGRKQVLEIIGGLVLLGLSAFGGSKLADLKPNLTLAKDLHVRLFDTLKFGGIRVQFGSGNSPVSPAPTPKPEPPPGVDVYLHLDVGQSGGFTPAQMDCGEDNNRRIGPFVDGDAGLNDDLRGDLKRIVAKITPLSNPPENAKPDRPTAIVLIGSADRRSLKPQTIRLYSSNAGLAQARVANVKKALKDDFKLDELPILEFYAGPEKTDAGLPLSELKSDRSVRVCFFWDRKR